MSLKLSHSSASKFQNCPKSWQLHYQQRYRPRLQSSALCFGTALDKSFEAMVKGEDAEDTFEKWWSFQEINKQVTYLPDSNLLAYYESDLELFLIDDAAGIALNKWLAENTPETRDWKVVFSEIEEHKQGVGLRNMHENRQRFHNLVFWYSLRAKGYLMLKALREQVLPRITKVISTQAEIKLKLPSGDSVTGFTDLICQWGPHENDIIIFDLKTSSRAYKDDAVLTSPQLALYVHALTGELLTRKAGFIVLQKQILKNKTKVCSKCNLDGTGSRARTCDKETADPLSNLGKVKMVRCGGDWIDSYSPEIFVQILIDNIPESQSDIVVENMDYISQAISSGIFVRNLQSCVMPYGKCSFYNLCHKDEVEDLLQMPDKDAPVEVVEEVLEE